MAARRKLARASRSWVDVLAEMQEEISRVRREKVKLFPFLLIVLLSACITVNVNPGKSGVTEKTNATTGGADASEKEVDCDEQVRTATRLVKRTSPSGTAGRNSKNSAPTTLQGRRAKDQDDCLLIERPQAGKHGRRLWITKSFSSLFVRNAAS
jgi:hypothetical protein